MDVAQLAFEKNLEVGSLLFDQFYVEPVFTVSDGPNGEPVLETLEAEMPPDIESRLFLGTADYLKILDIEQCPGWHITENFLGIVIAEGGSLTGKISFVYNSGDCDYTEDGQTYAWNWDASFFGKFEGMLPSDEGTITFYQDAKVEVLWDGQGKRTG